MDNDGLAPGRSVDIELGGQEVITIDLDNLDPNPEDVLDLLKEGQCKVWVWTKLAGEYWRRGYLEAAERISKAAIDSFESTGLVNSLPPIYALLANIQIAHARQAPKVILEDARQDIMAGEKPKDAYYKDAAQFLNASARYDPGSSLSNMLLFLTRGIQQLATRSLDDALRSFNSILMEKPTNLIALLGKARIEYAKRQYPTALKTFQNVLRLNPDCNPDPRIGIGLCLWAMGHHARARAAWERSLELNPHEWAAQLLLGLNGINTSKNEQLSEEERKQSFIAGTKLLEKAFKANQKSAAAANALCDILLQKSNYKRALKLAERTIQFADTLTVLTDGYLHAARVSHADGSILYATKFYSAAMEGQPNNLLAAIGLAQMRMKNDEVAAAIHTLDTILQPPNPQKSHEATIMLASLRAHPRPGVSTQDLAQERSKARELFERATKGLELEISRTQGAHTRGYRAVMEDLEVHIEIAKLWQGESLERVDKSLKEALRIGQATGKLDPRLLNNIGALRHMEGDLTEARRLYEASLTSASTLGANVADGASTSILYNLSRVYEEQGEDAMAKDAYEKLLSRHPEYVDGKIRQAHMLFNESKHNDAHELLKQALASQSNNLNLRAFYTYFLVQSNLPRVAKDFVFGTLKDFDRHDGYALCSAGWIMYQQARESRDPSPKGVEERKRNFQRAAELYEKALQRDPQCAFAAQGLAIVMAEDALGSLSGIAPAPGEAEVQRRSRNAREALDIFAKVRESINDGSVYFNMGHCYYARDEFDRAIESYETASTRFYHGQNISVLLCLCRSWYAKATKDQSFTAMNSALRYAQRALHIQPNDKAVAYNIGMIQQKSAEMLFAIPPSKRTLKDLKRAIDQAGHAQKLFASLAADKSPMVPYSRDIADQRRKYGDIMLRKGDEHLESQRQFESETQAKLDAARAKRQEEKDKQEALERTRMEELKKVAEKLAEERRIARERAQEWTREVKMESDEERERKERAKKVRKVKTEGAGSGDEGEPKKKRRGGKLKRAQEPQELQEGDEADAVFSDEDDGEKPAKKRPSKKRVVRDDDEETAAGPRKKQFKSKEMLSDTDEEME
ncbi:hypothetical protein HGRIS_003018 [Hohenbuehelia grisea]|uniref:Uncharacterized protein n=1 Tax=Hohenbuehelia grisea TaxID=104357 RepID=A0ABR3JM72_9AGAR